MSDSKDKKDRDPLGSSQAGLVVEPESKEEGVKFQQEVTNILESTEEEVLKLARDKDEQRAWQEARVLVENFQPVPWFIWRLSNYVFGSHGQINKISEGLVLGLRRLLFAAASDKVLGTGTKINDIRKALHELPSDIVAAVAVIHAISRRLHTKQFERIWRPILDDAILRAQIGFYIGQMNPKFGPGRGMLAGFAGRSGLAILISTGKLEQARGALDQLAAGKSITDVGVSLYGVDPLQVSAMTLSASGCGRDAAFGTVSFASGKIPMGGGEEQERWLAAFAINEAARTGKREIVPDALWKVLGFDTEQDQDDLFHMVKMLVRKGHGWNWLIGAE